MVTMDTAKTVAATFTLNGSVTDGDSTTDLPKTGQTASYAPGDDGSMQAGIEWPAPRFTDNGDGTVTDQLTGLMWLKDGSCLRKNWSNALNTITDLNSNPRNYTCLEHLLPAILTGVCLMRRSLKVLSIMGLQIQLYGLMPKVLRT